MTMISHYKSIIILLTLLCTGCSQQSLARLDEAPPAQVEMRSPDILRTYDAFYVAPIDVYSVEGDYLRRVDQDEVGDLAVKLRTKLIRELDTRSTAFPQPAKSVALIRVALTDVSTNYAAFQLAPGLIVPNAMRGGASIDAEFVDSISGKTIARVRDSRSGKREGFFSGLGKWDGVEKAFDEWAQLLSDSIRR